MRLQAGIHTSILFVAAMACAIAVSLTACGGRIPLGLSSPQNSGVTAVLVNCSPSGVNAGGTVQCSATVQGTGSYDPAVTWSSSAGTITQAGVLTAPTTAGEVMVQAASAQDSQLTGSATVSVAPAAAPPAPSSITSVTVSCSPTAVNTGAISYCTAAVAGTGSYSSAVTWSSSAGAITQAGVLTAPANAGNVTVLATSVQDTSRSGSAAVSVVAAAAPPTPVTITSVTVSCSPTSVYTGGTSQCTAAVAGTGSYSSAVTWSSSAGAITQAGVLTAPASAGTVTVRATSMQDTSRSGSAVVSVAAPAPPPTPATITSVSVSCSPTTLNTGATSHCTAAVTGTGSYSSAVTWFASGGSISSSGVFTAPANEGDVTVTATSTQDTSKSADATLAVQLAVPASRHVVLVMEENQSYSTVVGQDAVWPNLNKLIQNGALPLKYYANTHPSIGNYLMLTTGQVLTNNDNSTEVWNVDNIARRMLAAGVSFRIYAEGIPRGYVGGNTGAYLVRHNPFALLSDIADNTNVANQVIWPFSQFAADLASGTLPEFSYIVPDVNDDAHNGTPQQADSWLESKVVIPLSQQAAFKSGGDGLLIVDFDEAEDGDTSYGGGHVSPVLWGPIVKPGYQQTTSTVYQHPSMLRTMMDALGLGNPPAAAASAPSMPEFFVQK